MRGALVEEGASVRGSIIGPDFVVEKGRVVRDEILAR